MRGRATVVVAALIGVAAAQAAPAGAAVVCDFEPSGGTLTVTADTVGDTMRVVRSGDSLRVHGPAGEVECSGGGATVTGTGSIDLVDSSAGATESTVDLTGGRLAPGDFDEGGPPTESEIEVNVTGGAGDGDVLVVLGGPGADDMRLGHDGMHGPALNLNPAEEEEPDADVLTAGVEVVQVDGGDGDDVLDARGGAGTGSPARGTYQLLGDDGADRLTASDGGSTLTGGTGADVLIGAAGPDRVRARDGFGDTIDCGGGADRVESDRPGIDAITGCETVTTGPGGSSASGGGATDPRASFGVELVEAGLGLDAIPEDVTPPVIRDARLTRLAFRGTVATTLHLRVSEPVWLDLVVRRVLRRGRTRGAGEASVELARGRHALRFAPTGLAKGRYRLVLITFDDQGNRGRPVTLRFLVR